MRLALIIAATVVLSGYMVMLLRHGIRWTSANRSIRARQKSGGGMFGQVNSVTGRVRPPSIGLSFWFLLLVCAVVLVKIWWL